MDDSEFDEALTAAAFALAGRSGWGSVSVAVAATEAALPLARARARFPGRLAILRHFGVLADLAALADATLEGPVRDRLFDMLMRRIDTLQSHRDGVIALLRYVPTDPPLAFLLARATRRSMRWMLEAAGVVTRGLHGELRVKGLVAVWLWTVRAWRTDESADLAGTMAALDQALGRADRAEGWLKGRSMPERAPTPPDGEPDLPPVPLDPPPEFPPSPPAVV